ncbi:MAG: sigma-70 family RNA polymerase sigma factor, partial [Nannocystaceae bacterium]|nr:sigma-70 family RNA polymerase sigma factor [Nannocystaceae bacterium]
MRNDDAEDVAQDAFVTALSQPKKPRSLRPWLRQVVRNQSRARARSEHRRRTREQASPIPEPLGTPDEEASHAQIVAAVNEALLELDAPYRDVLRARFFADRTAAEIANSEGCPAGTVRWRVQEGLRRVRRKLDERFDGRRQWLGGMAFIAGVPLPPPMAAPTPGSSTMTKLMILKVLAAAAIVTAGAAAVNVADAETMTAEQADVAQEHVSTATQSAAAAVLAPTAKADAVKMSIARAAASEHAAADVAGEASDDAACPTCSLGAQGDPLPSTGDNDVGGDLTDCFENVDTDPGEMIALRITAGETPAGEPMVVADAIFVDERFEQVEGLAECVAAALDGSFADRVAEAGSEVFISVVL